jgi:KaiC/GvpD/RAD55 family RecA-like ATPase
MSQSSGGAYGFSDAIPVEPIDAGATVFVSGPALSPAEDLAQRLVADGCQSGDGSLFITTNVTSDRLLDGCQRTHPDFDFGRAGVIDCSGQDVSDRRQAAQVKYISTQSDLTGIGMKFSSLYESLYMESGGPVRTGLLTVSSLAMYVDLRKLFQFIQTLSARIDSADGIGVFAIDPTTHDTRTINTLSQVADGRIEVREADDADGELRVRGLAGQPDDWQPFTLPD